VGLALSDQENPNSTENKAVQKKLDKWNAKRKMQRKALE
jgi:hypothetical protein